MATDPPLPLATDDGLVVPREPATDALYVHVPFCTHKCPYCAFACTDEYERSDFTRFQEGIERELRVRVSHVDRRRLRTLYYGGGTPSALGCRGLRSLTQAVESRFDLGSLEEFTVELNPGQVDDPMAIELASMRVDRTSLGAQTFHPEHLRRLGRDHEIPDVARALSALRKAGIEAVNIDLMYALPLQTTTEFSEDLRTALDLGAVHLSLYALEFEPSTPFGKAKAQGKMIPTDDGTAADMFHRARELCAAYGLYWYEVSNFAVPGFESRHNQAYWNNRPYVGIGPGAYGRIADIRYRNATEIGPWHQAIMQGLDPAIEKDLLTDEIDAIETLVAGLRTREGVRWPEPKGVRGGDHRERTAQALVAEGLGLITDRRFRLTVRGMLVLDSILPRFLSTDDRAT